MVVVRLRVPAKLAVLLCASFSALVFASLFAASADAQAVAEAAGTTSVSASAASAMKSVTMPKFPTVGAAPAGSNGGASSPHLIASSAPPAEETNRRAIESQAGKDAGKLLLRATPVDAQVWIDGKIVGKTPMLLVLAPGRYQVEMRGTRGETAKSRVDLLPRETRELPLKLQLLYPARVTAVRPQ
jgi:hypothetical protein